MAILEGGCLCGAVRYSCDADPMATVLCHCTTCQKLGGGAYSVNVVLPKGSLTVKGTPAVFSDTGDSGKTVQRMFCATCGSPISSQPEAVDSITVLKAGSLDDTGWLKPTMEIYCDSAQDWTRQSLELESHPGMMPA